MRHPFLLAVASLVAAGLALPVAAAQSANH